MFWTDLILESDCNEAASYDKECELDKNVIILWMGAGMKLVQAATSVYVHLPMIANALLGMCVQYIDSFIYMY
jgi:hypothetical protein